MGRTGSSTDPPDGRERGRLRPEEGFVPPEPGVDVDDLIAEPYASVADARDRLAALEARFRNHDDRRAVFLTVYVAVTERVQERIEAGEFRDPAWVADYLVTFADYYRRALLAYERGNAEAVPDPWVLAFDTARRGRALVVQDALLGINAHVVHDLALAVHDVGVDPNRPAKHADHVAVNDVLRRLIDAEQRLLADHYAPGLTELDASAGRIDEALASLSLEEGREFAWHGAVARTDLRTSVADRAVRWLLEAVATGNGRAILAPNDSPLLARLRELESGA
ncbi:DUF5995 family protein [Haloplanus sp. GCM10025708]|uniref:DUF5995 family protein n=1 Tax=Haloplanus sp. GCM10025708 TaxID=3252679 RepID=UPI00360ECB3A